MPIELEGVSKTYHTREGQAVVALREVTTAIADGEFVTLIGPSGCGKTTLLSLLAGLDDTTSGSIRFSEGSSLAPGSKPGMLFQQPILLPWRTALQNVLLPAEVGTGAGDPESAERRAFELLSLVGLEGFEKKYPWELSGGMQQRVAIARGLLRDSKVLLFDEPFSALDEFTREQMNLELLDIWGREKFTVIFVTHNVFEAVFLSDRVFVMTPRPGKVAGIVDIELERPRRPEVLASPEFARHVGLLRSVMDEHWAMASDTE
jgi:NitT/TauT family transport system ATP-binding protein